MPIDLKNLRESAKFPISQAELAQRLGISQTQVSRYEEAPDNVPFPLMLKWARALGKDPAELAEEAELPPPTGIDPGRPFERLHEELRFLKQFVAKSPVRGSDLPEGAPDATDLVALADILGRKPNLCTRGPFDGGKSTVLNALLGSNSLPTSYQPATKVVTYVRHIEDRPAWMTEDVWLLKRGFNPLQWDEQKHCEDCCVVRGNLETLKQYGTHDGRHATDTEAHYAVVFLDAPILRSCNVIDLPGDDNDAADSEKAASNPVQADVVIYTSPYNGFLRAADMMRLGQLVRELPMFEAMSADVEPLGNVFVLATHASTTAVKDAELDGIFTKGAGRIMSQLGDTAIAWRAEQTHRTIDQSAVHARLFSFYKEAPRRRERFDAAMRELLTQKLPAIWKKRADNEIIAFRERAKDNLRQLIDTYTSMVENMRRARSELERVRSDEPNRRRRLSEAHAQVEAAVGRFRADALTHVEREYARLTDIDVVEKMIRSKFGNDKKEAQEYAGVVLLESIQNSVERKNAALSGQFSTAVQDFLGSYTSIELQLGTERRTISIPFNATGAFVGGLAGAVSVGALAAWAASLGNLGAYIIAAKAVSLLAALGVSIPGGTAAVMASIAAIGGPVTLALGVVALAVLAGWALFGDSWQRRLAKKIAATYTEKGVLAKWQRSIEDYWANTLTAFRQGAREVEQKWLAYLNDLEKVASGETEGLDDAVARLERLKQAREFFGGLPWRAETA
jgi:transcriptional regulator with XRE-family HTH domain